jgi:hypothetical protein
VGSVPFACGVDVDGTVDLGVNVGDGIMLGRTIWAGVGVAVSVGATAAGFEIKAGWICAGGEILVSDGAKVITRVEVGMVVGVNILNAMGAARDLESFSRAE